MKGNEQPIPLRSVVCLPRWLMVGGVALSAGCMLAGVGIAVYGIGWGEGRSVAGWLGGAFGCLIGGAGGLFGTLNDWRRRLPATALLHHIHNDQVNPLYRRVFWPGLVILTISVIAGCIWNEPWIWHGGAQTSGIMTFIAGTIEAARRHTTAQAHAVFALYADGSLEPDDMAAIDDARQQDDRFDREVREYLEVSEQVRTWAAGGAE